MQEFNGEPSLYWALAPSIYGLEGYVHHFVCHISKGHLSS